MKTRTLQIMPSGNQFIWRYLAANGKIIAHGERYRRHRDLMKTVGSLFGFIVGGYIYRNGTRIARLEDMTKNS